MLLTSLKIENLRGISLLELDFDTTTVLIGENNCGKTTVLHALKACLSLLRSSGRSQAFDDFDLHFASSSVEPADAPPITITLTFEESTPGEWGEEIEQKLGGDGGVVMLVPPDDRSRVKLRVNAQYSAITQEVETSFAFLDAADAPLAGKSQNRLRDLQQLRPMFYLSALRDAGKEFSRSAQFWAPFVRNSQIDPEKKAELEKRLEELNEEIVDCHGTFKGVREHLSQVQELVQLGPNDTVSVDAVPGRFFDMLNRTQVSVASLTGARLPINRHGEGTQSLAVLLLFDAFVKTELARREGAKDARPIVALEEPEAHLHPHAVRALWKTVEGINGQKVVATHSGDLLSEVQLSSIRRIYRKNGVPQIGRIKRGRFTPEDEYKFAFAVQRARGELFFARTWLLGEGETEAHLLVGAAQVLNIDLEREGVRTFEYRSGDIDFFLDAANDLGISWHSFMDGDEQGKTDQAKAAARIPGGAANNALHVTALPGSVEDYLAASGFFDVYDKLVPPATKQQKVNAKSGTPEYVREVMGCVKKKLKILGIYEVVKEMRNRGEASVPPLVRGAVEKAVQLARSQR